jgi:cardiolipin synthase
MEQKPRAKRDKAADRAARTVTVAGNRLQFLPDGPERLDALLDLIRGATHSLRLLYYIYEPDRAGARVR